MRELLLIPLEDVVVFPNMTVTLSVDVGDETEVLLVPRHDGSHAAVGTVASVGDRVRLPGGGRAVTLEGLHRALIGAARTDTDGRLRAQVEERPDEPVAPIKTDELAREYRAVVEEILELRGADERVASFLRAVVEPVRWPTRAPTRPTSRSRTGCACSRRSTSSSACSSRWTSSVSA
jgi:ATP-dependent Lon protease